MENLWKEMRLSDLLVNKISRTASETRVPPGSRTRMALHPSSFNFSMSSRAWVDLPQPSMPSNVMKRVLAEVDMGIIFSNH